MSPGVPLVAGARIPLGFIALGLTALATAAGWISVQPDLFLQPFLHPRVVALVHLWIPGFLLSVSMGAVYQLMPVVLGSALRLPLGAAWAHLALHAVGVPLMVYGFATGRYAWVGLGGACVMCGAGLLCLAIFRTFRAAHRRDAAAWSFPIAGSWLGATVLIGVMLAWNRHHAYLPLPVVALLQAHAHLGLIGFFLSLLQGTTFQLVPMFTMGSLQKPRFVWTGLLGTQAGLLFLAPGLAWQQTPLIVAGAVLIAGAVAFSGVALRATFASRRRKKLEPGLQAFACGAIAAAVCAGGGLLLVTCSGGGERHLNAITAYGLTCIAGALTLMVLGMLCKIVPFLVWMRSYGPVVGKRPVPLATALASSRLERLWLYAHVTAVVLLIAAVFASSSWLAHLGAWLLAGAIASFLISIGQVARHLRPATALPAPPTRPAFSSP